MTKQKIALADARVRAMTLMDALYPACERIMIAGSIRREKDFIGDIELVLIPKRTPITDLFGAETGLYDDTFNYTLLDLDAPIIKNGEKYKQITWQDMSADLFICTKETWGCNATIRTGSADFTHWLVTPKMQGGACPGHMKFKDARLWLGGMALETPEEQDIFDQLELDWIPPQERIEGRWKR